MSSLSYWIPVEVGAGKVKREDSVVSVVADFPRLLNQFTDKWLNPDSVTVYDEKEQEIPSQYDSLDETVSWLMDGVTEPEQKRTYKLGFDVLGKELPFKARYPRYPSNVDLADMDGGLRINVGGSIWGGRHFTTYIYGGESVTALGVGGDLGGSLWKPSFCPVNGPLGNLVRGSEEEHPHQHGLYISYGAHISAEGTNIWAETVKGPWGPCGRIVHEAFESCTNGPVYGRFVEKLAYTKPDGYKFMAETRDVKVFASLTDDFVLRYNLPAESMVMDVSSTLTCPNEVGVRGVMICMRVANSMREMDGGRIENSEGGVGEEQTRGKKARWVDYSGPVGSGLPRKPVLSSCEGNAVKGWNGIAAFDDESNPEFPAEWGTNAGPMAIVTNRYSFPDDFPLHGILRLKWRFYVHDGDAKKGKVTEKYLDYSTPLDVTLGKPYEQKA